MNADRVWFNGPGARLYVSKDAGVTWDAPTTPFQFTTDVLGVTPTGCTS